MNTTECLKPGIQGATIGAATVGIAGFTWGGWVAGGTARDRAMAVSHDDFVEAMVPVCLGKAQNDPDRVAKATVIRDAQIYKRRDALMEADWATVPGAEAPDRDNALACLASREADAFPEQPEIMADEG